MFRNNNRVLLSAIVIAVSATLALGQGTATYASTGGPQGTSPATTVTATTTSQPRISMARLNQRVSALPELAGLKNGDLVTLYDDGSMTGSKWEGTYVWRPAGSQIQMNNLYARWGDGVVAITMADDPADDDDDTAQPFATFIQQEYATTTNDDGDEVVTAISERQVTKPLVTEPTNPNILRIPDNAWLFRSAGNGQYTALVDVLEFRSGSTPLRQEMTDSTNEWVEDGAQPVGVMVK